MQTVTLKLSDQTALKIYEESSLELKKVLEESFPAGFFSKSIIERVNSVDDLFLIGGKTKEQIVSPADTKDEAAYKLLKFGIKVLNGPDWEADYSDETQDKYEPRFIFKPGFGLVFDHYDFWYSSTTVGLRLCYRDYNTMAHGIKIMQEWYHDFYN